MSGISSRHLRILVFGASSLVMILSFQNCEAPRTVDQNGAAPATGPSPDAPEISIERAKAKPKICSFNGETLEEGDSVIAWQSEFDTSCVSEVRRCANGELSGSFTHPGCTEETQTRGAQAAAANASGSTSQPTDCVFRGRVIPEGGTVTAFREANPVSPGVCESQVRTCTGGSLSGSFDHQSCDPVAAGQQSCKFSGMTIPHKGKIVAFRTNRVDSNHKTCDDVKEVRQCLNGSLSGSYEFRGCREMDDADDGKFAIECRNPRDSNRLTSLTSSANDIEGASGLRHTCRPGKLLEDGMDISLETGDAPVRPGQVQSVRAFQGIAGEIIELKLVAANLPEGSKFLCRLGTRSIPCEPNARIQIASSEPGIRSLRVTHLSAAGDVYHDIVYRVLFLPNDFYTTDQRNNSRLHLRTAGFVPDKATTVLPTIYGGLSVIRIGANARVKQAVNFADIDMVLMPKAATHIVNHYSDDSRVILGDNSRLIISSNYGDHVHFMLNPRSVLLIKTAYGPMKLTLSRGSLAVVDGISSKATVDLAPGSAIFQTTDSSMKFDAKISPDSPIDMSVPCPGLAGGACPANFVDLTQAPTTR